MNNFENKTKQWCVYSAELSQHLKNKFTQHRTQQSYADHVEIKIDRMLQWYHGKTLPTFKEAQDILNRINAPDSLWEAAKVYYASIRRTDVLDKVHTYGQPELPPLVSPRLQQIIDGVAA